MPERDQADAGRGGGGPSRRSAHPPSGPTIRRASGGVGTPRSTASDSAAPSAPGLDQHQPHRRGAARRDRSRTSAAYESPAARPGATASPTPARSGASDRAARREAARRWSSRCGASRGWIAATPSITASRTTSSILSPLRIACTSVTETGSSAAGSIRDRSWTRTSRRTRTDDAGQVFAAPSVEHRHFVSRGDAQDARQVLGFVARERDRLVPGIERRREETVHGGELYGAGGLGAECWCCGLAAPKPGVTATGEGGCALGMISRKLPATEEWLCAGST